MPAKIRVGDFVRISTDNLDDVSQFGIGRVVVEESPEYCHVYWYGLKNEIFSQYGWLTKVSDGEALVFLLER